MSELAGASDSGSNTRDCSARGGFGASASSSGLGTPNRGSQAAGKARAAAAVGASAAANGMATLSLAEGSAAPCCQAALAGTNSLREAQPAGAFAAPAPAQALSVEHE